MTTNQFRSINFLNQTGDFNYNLNLTANNNTGFFEFGFSGTNSKLAFKNQYGKIKDTNDNIIIGYVPNRELNINGSIISGRETLSIDNTLIYSNIPNTGYNFNYFYLNPIGCSLDYNFSLTGGYTELSSAVTTPKIKNYNIIVDDKNNPFVTKTLTGILVNQNPNLEVKIFSAVATSKTDTYSLNGFPITFNNTGTYLINSSTGIDALVNDTFDALFYTNFGNITKTISISGEVIPLFFLFFDVSPAISGFPNVQTGYDQIFVNVTKDYSLSYGYVSGANVQLSLSYVSGLTGNVTGFLSATGKFNGTLSGYLTGSGYISSYVATGVLFSGGNDFLNNVQYVTDSGFYAQQFKVATGYSKGNYVITGYGLGSGYVYQDVFASGKVKILVTGNVPYVGGLTVAVNPYPFTGSGIAYNQNNSGFIATGIVDGYFPNLAQLLYTGALTGIILSSAQYSGKNFSFTPPKDSVVVASDSYKIVATGYQSGIGPTGKVNDEFFIDFDQGYYTFVKNFSGITGESRATDEEDIITGNLGILNCNLSQKRKYISYASGLSGTVTGSAYLSLCDADSAIPSGFIATATTTGNIESYVITGECGEIGQILDQALPKFIVIKPTGTYELKTKTLETGINYAFNQESYYLLNDTGIRTHIFGAGSGYFSNIVGTCQNSGRWEHLFSANEIIVQQNTSDYIVNNINFDLITLEDDGQNYFSDVYFKSTGIFEQFNLKLNTTNKPIQVSPARNIFYRLILSKKITDVAYSGLYESDFIEVSNTINFCTGLYQGDYRLKVKYVNVNISPTVTPICRIPIQIVNIVDKNYYNKNNIDIFTGQLSTDFDTFRFRGSGYHNQSNIFYTKSEVYGTQFLNTTGFTQQYLTDLYKAPEQDFTNFNNIYNNSIIKAIEFSITGLTGWSNSGNSGIRNINIVTNYIALSGWTKNEFLNYIKDIYTKRRTIVNVLNCPNRNATKDNFESFDSMDEFLKDVATIGGGTYYNCSNNLKSNVDSYIGYNGLIPLNYYPVFATCNGYYPGQVTQFSTTDGEQGIDIIAAPQMLPPLQPVIVDVPDIETTIEDHGSDITPDRQKVEPQRRTYGGGGGGSTSGPGPSPNPPNPANCDERNLATPVNITSATYTTKPKVKLIGGICTCIAEGVLTIKGTIENPNCIGKDIIITATAKMIKNGVEKKYFGETTVTLLGKNGETVPRQEGINYNTTPYKSSVASIEYGTAKRPEGASIPPFESYKSSVVSIGPNTYTESTTASIQPGTAKRPEGASIQYGTAKIDEGPGIQAQTYTSSVGSIPPTQSYQSSTTSIPDKNNYNQNGVKGMP